MKAWLLGEGYLVSRKRVRRLMRFASASTDGEVQTFPRSKDGKKRS